MKPTTSGLLIILCFLNLTLYAQETTAIPDPMFEQYLIDQEIDTDGEVNGQVWTADIENLTNLEIDGGTIELYYGSYIQDLTGIEDFINLDSLSVYGTYITQLPLQSLANLKYLYCTDNNLESLDLSSNSLLEVLYAGIGGDMEPMNELYSIDLSQNPNIKKVVSNVLGGINLKNGNNNPEMRIDLSNHMEDETGATICIAVDDSEAAANNEYPYNQWDYGSSPNYWLSLINFTDDLEACNLGLGSKEKTKIGIYPNPTTAYIYFDNSDKEFTLELYNINGIKVLSQQINPNTGKLDLSNLSDGIYFYSLITEANSVQTGKIIKN